MNGVLRWRLHLGAVVLSLSLLGGCSDPETQLVVVTYSNLKVPRDIDGVQFRVTGPDGMDITETASLVGDEAVMQPFSLGLFPKGDALGPVMVTVSGREGDEDVLTRSARTEFVRGESRILRLDLLTDCLGVTCGAEQTCAEGVCVSADVPGSSLPIYDGSLPPRIVPDASQDADATLDSGVPTDSAMDAAPDSAPTDSATDAPTDSGMDAPADSGLDAPMDAPMDAMDTSVPPDTGPTCPPSSMPLPRVMSRTISGELTAASSYSHIVDSMCPSTPTTSNYAYQSYVFCNEGPLGVWDIYQEGTDTSPTLTLEDPWIVVYDGTTIPADTGMCLDSNDDYGATFDSRVTLLLDPGQVVTVVASSYCDVDMDACPFAGIGTYLMRIVPR